MHKISIYDMDKTITRKATFGPFLAYAVPRYQPWRLVFVPLVLLATAGYALRLVNRGRLKEFNLGLMLGKRIQTAHLQRLACGFAGRTLAKNVLARAMDRIAADRTEGRRIVLATASYDFYVDEIAKLIGVSNVIATVATQDAAATSPKIVGENCYGAAKLTMVEAWLSAQGIARGDAHIRFYSDHISDAPCLSWADEAFATNPHPPLRAMALRERWTVFDWA